MNNTVVLSILGMGGIGLFFAVILAIANERFKVNVDPTVEKLEAALPGLNCGGCGFLSCHDYAVHVADASAGIDVCKPGGEQTQSALAAVMGVEAAGAVALIKAVVHCAADGTVRKEKADYAGAKTCAAANIVTGGQTACEYGCLGFADCFRACPFDAITMGHGLPRIDLEKCVACGKCVTACPRNIISLETLDKDKGLVSVACVSRYPGAETRKVCTVGCIACGICVKFSGGAFRLEDNLAIPDHTKTPGAANMPEVIAKCPTKVIKRIKI